MISRHWRAIARSASADEYVKHLREETFPEIGRLPGFSVRPSTGATGPKASSSS